MEISNETINMIELGLIYAGYIIVGACAIGLVYEFLWLAVQALRRL